MTVDDHGQPTDIIMDKESDTESELEIIDLQEIHNPDEQEEIPRMRHWFWSDMWRTLKMDDMYAEWSDEWSTDNVEEDSTDPRYQREQEPPCPPEILMELRP